MKKIVLTALAALSFSPVFAADNIINLECTRETRAGKEISFHYEINLDEETVVEDNAIKFTTSGIRERSGVIKRVKTMSSSIIEFVTDNGNGIELENIKINRRTGVYSFDFAITAPGRVVGYRSGTGMCKKLDSSNKF